jgi:hypothetical protein
MLNKIGIQAQVTIDLISIEKTHIRIKWKLLFKNKNNEEDSEASLMYNKNNLPSNCFLF